MNQKFNARTTVLLCALICLALMPEVAFAQAQDGASFLQKLKDWVFGPIGLAIGLLGGAWGILEWMRDGFKSSVGIFMGVVAFFFLPTAAVFIQSLAKT